MAVHSVPQVRRENGVTVIALGGDYQNLDEQTTEELREVILETVGQADPPCVVLDLSQIQFFGSAFIELLFRAWNRLKGQDGGEMALSGLTPYCAEVIQVTHLDRLWKTYPTPDEAVQDMHQE